ncbi:hypothetical protein AB4Z32_25665 [Massilia sp. 2TAF26]|uniref:hypothetical protein n=1 Tax=Massilia sp. 2TAF26 TaxID=3233012 RepID=UPI003F9D2835
MIPPLSANPHNLTQGEKIGESHWPDGSTVIGGHGQAFTNVRCALNENYHQHVHLTVIVDGIFLSVPADIGLQGCAYELHTHDRSGIIHIESDRTKTFNLGDFFSVWGQPLSQTTLAEINRPVRAFVQGPNASIATEYFGDPSRIDLTPKAEITLIIGALPSSLPRYIWPSSL